jgi:transposase-like protein
MRIYPDEFKASVIAKLLPPYNRSIAELVKETGIPKETLYGWRSKLSGLPKGSGQAHRASELSSPEKFQLAAQTQSMNELDLGEFCRQKGIFPEQLAAWRQNCLEANSFQPRREEQSVRREQAKLIKELECELRRKERALAETAALLVLQKKAREIWGDPVDARSMLRRDEA